MEKHEEGLLSEDKTLARLIFEIRARYYNNPEINPPPIILLKSKQKSCNL